MKEKVFTTKGRQSAEIGISLDEIYLHCRSEEINMGFVLHMNSEEAIEIAENLMFYADMLSSDKKLSK